MYSTRSTKAKVWGKGMLLKKTGRSVWSGVKCQTKSPSNWLACRGSQEGSGSGSGPPGGGRAEAEFALALARTALTHHTRHATCVFFLRSHFSSGAGRGPATQWANGTRHTARGMPPCPCPALLVAPSQLLLPFLHSGPCTQSCSTDDPHGTALFSASTTHLTCTPTSILLLRRFRARH